MRRTGSKEREVCVKRPTISNIIILLKSIVPMTGNIALKGFKLVDRYIIPIKTNSSAQKTEISWGSALISINKARNIVDRNTCIELVMLFHAYKNMVINK